ncbi:MAG: GIY-YIG nuclease family protein [Rubrivivax sp.]|nr:MAG: GIY-YIG nuclease family protein [Rubrivivax sp.]
MDEHYVYLIACRSDTTTYVKVGMTSSIQRRLSNIQTGCPHPITHAFVILSEYLEEVQGLEKLLHQLLAPQCLRAEWYEGNADFFQALDEVLTRINAGGFSWEELLDTPDFVGPEFEIMLHGHQFEFKEVVLPLRKGADVLEGSRPVTPGLIADVLRMP